MGHWQKNNITQRFGGRNWPGKNEQDSDRTQRHHNPPDEGGPAHGVMPMGMLNACTPRWAWFTHSFGWDYILGHVNQVQQNSHVPSLTGLQHKVEGTQEAAIPTQVSTHYNVIISLSNYLFIVIYFYKHFINFTEQAFFILCKFSTVPPPPPKKF